MRLQGKVAVVTGGGSGFGEGIARLFAAEGGRVVVADINGDAAERVAAQIDAAGGAAVGLRADVTAKADVDAMMRAALDSYGRLDILVNNAGVSHRNKPMTEVSEEEFDRIYDVNVKAIYLAAVAAIPLMKAQGGGCIVNTSSTAALRPRPGLTVYNSSKGAVNVMTKSMAVELAPDKIRVNAICPVIGETALMETFMGVPDTPENRKKFEATIPLGRFSTPKDIAEATLFLASDSANFLTGVTLEVDGGRCI
ncbi:glucose 1-dehydrogenase [Pelagibius litoralis]|uniref:Glucose 1-dehydrogenase n=1 Tax=Pelagibius litoralis TaxID=374515 RepID=A0A967F117_9PROT|nr:glucose 1-dehydrogenase [Pelagibius litoralis]NIA71059.1 glucose 1-dehydrogenase [Pelagibius litoralis]